MPRRSLLLAGVTALIAAAPAAGQGRDCTIVDADDVRRLVGGNGRTMFFVRGPLEIHCQGGIVVRADSAHSTGTGELRLIRDVFYQDSAQTLTSETATYYRDLGRLMARGDVVLRDRAGPSVIRGSELQYDREMPDRPDVRMVVRGRPRAYLYEEGTPPLPEGLEPAPVVRVVDGDTVPSALQVDADRLEIVGESRMLAHGRVQMVREELRAFGSSVDYDRVGGRMELTGDARVEGEGYELFGDRITATLTDEELDRVLSEGDALLLGEELRVDAPVIDIELAGGDVERMIAVTRGPREGERAHAAARDFAMVADSIQADAPGDRIDRIVAVGDAYGERTVDSLAIGLPDLIQRDWVRGDTIVVTFVRLEGGIAAEDTARTALETLTAMGAATPARSLYRMEASSEEADRPAVNYMIARRIAIRFEEGEVAHVSAEGPVDGMHLEPVRAARAAEPPAEGAGPGDGLEPGNDPDAGPDGLPVPQTEASR